MRPYETLVVLSSSLGSEQKPLITKFEDLVKKHSDGPRANEGGPFGTWHAFSRRTPPHFTRAVAALAIGGVSDLVETPFGFHILKRAAKLPPPPLLAGAHILIAYKGAMRAAPTITRTKAAAKALAVKLTKQVKAKPASFAELAKKHSDGPSGKRAGGSLGNWPKGRMHPAFDAAVVKLKVGQITAKPVETSFGFHIIRRDASKRAGGIKTEPLKKTPPTKKVAPKKTK